MINDTKHHDETSKKKKGKRATCSLDKDKMKALLASQKAFLKKLCLEEQLECETQLYESFNISPAQVTRSRRTPTACLAAETANTDVSSLLDRPPTIRQVSLDLDDRAILDTQVQEENKCDRRRSIISDYSSDSESQTQPCQNTLRKQPFDIHPFDDDCVSLCIDELEDEQHILDHFQEGILQEIDGDAKSPPPMEANLVKSCSNVEAEFVKSCSNVEAGFVKSSSLNEHEDFDPLPLTEVRGCLNENHCRIEADKKFFCNDNMLKSKSIRSLDDSISDKKQYMLTLISSIGKSQDSQHNIQLWDRKMGLKRSHSRTMSLSNKTRKKVRAMLRKDIRYLGTAPQKRMNVWEAKNKITTKGAAA